jgi:hypothetical protein
MADITLAEWNERVWLVGGEGHIDDLLANTLAPEITIEIIACEQKSRVHELWELHCGPQQGFVGDPWLIHPAIVARIKRADAPQAVLFAAWSAALDAEAHAVIDAAAAWAAGNPEARITLIARHDPNGPAGLADLARLRGQLVAAALVTAGVDASRIDQSLAEADAAADRVDLETAD